MSSGTAGALVVRGLAAGYGRMRVVAEVDLDVKPGELVCMVGRNGAGKSTTVSAICGIRHGGFSGSVRLGDIDLSRAVVREVAGAGLALVPEGHQIFPELSVLENLRMGAYALRRAPGVIREQLALVHDLFPALHEFRRKAAGALSGGQQQMVSIGQAIMSRPSVLVLDEPSSGLALGVVDDIYGALDSLRERGIGLLVIEQNVGRALERGDRCYVLEGGRIALQGTCAELAADDRVNDIVMGVASVSEVDAALDASG
jgi:ABC-type branched-subunit amino acid transport system ATPase component